MSGFWRALPWLADGCVLTVRSHGLSSVCMHPGEPAVLCHEGPPWPHSTSQRPKFHYTGGEGLSTAICRDTHSAPNKGSDNLNVLVRETNWGRWDSLWLLTMTTLRPGHMCGFLIWFCELPPCVLSGSTELSTLGAPGAQRGLSSSRICEQLLWWVPRLRRDEQPELCPPGASILRELHKK